MTRTFLLFLFSYLVVGAGLPSFAQADGPHFKKVIWIVFENTGFSSALAQADFAKWAKQGVLFQKFSGEAHPSQPNYIAMIAGSTLGVKADNNVDLTARHLGDLLESAHLDWRVYAEDFPGNCFLGKTNRSYARKHVPFISFKSVSSDAQRCKKIVNADQFDQDFSSHQQADFTMYIPNLKDDGHDTGVNFAGKWFAKRFANILNEDGLKDTLFIITFDESDSILTNNIYTVLLGEKVLPGVKNNQSLNHYSLLKLIEDEWQLGSLNQNDMAAPTITGVWK